MDATEVAAYIREAFPDVETTTAYTYTFFFYGSERMLPFATLATADNEHDRVSDLDRDGAYRLNVGVSRDTYRSLLGDEKPRLGPAGVIDTGHDFTLRDQILPHPHRRVPDRADVAEVRGRCGCRSTWAPRYAGEPAALLRGRGRVHRRLRVQGGRPVERGGGREPRGAVHGCVARCL
jgi:hypothetical protein